jgi:hypothetical protein
MSVRFRLLTSLSLVSLFGIGASPAAAQDFSYGIKGGLNVSNISFKTDDTSVLPGSRGGFAIGGFVESWLRMEGWTVLTEALISQKGSQVDSLGSDASVRLTYLEVPVLLRAAVQGPRRSVMHLYIGPAFSIELGEGLDPEDAADDDVFKPFDVGLTFGGSIEIRKAILDVRYSLGLADIADEDDFLDGVSARNRTFSILVGWRLR